ncbi:MAG: thiolase C-terminal domain-containing protein [Candidatus Njordarchaeales archaeon]
MPVYVRGYGLTRVGEHWDKNLIDLAVDACLQALESANLRPSDLDGVYVANALSNYLNHQGLLEAYLADYLGIMGKTLIRVESDGASGGLAIYQAFKDVASGLARNVLVCGLEKLTDVLPSHITSARNLGSDWLFLSSIGATQEALQAILLQLYMDRYNAQHENIANLAVVSHEHAVTAPHAQFRRKITIESVMKSPTVADPLRIFEVPAPGDGAAALIISAEKGDVEIVGSSVANDKFRIYEREDPLWLESVYLAAQNAYRQAGVSPSEIDFVELYDSSTIMGVLELESLGFVERGEGHKLVGSEDVKLGGRTPVNTFGGLKARGDPVGATGIYQAVESYLQLSNNAGNNQVEKARVGLAISIGGIGAISVVNIFKRR